VGWSRAQDRRRDVAGCEADVGKAAARYGDTQERPALSHLWVAKVIGPHDRHAGADAGNPRSRIVRWRGAAYSRVPRTRRVIDLDFRAPRASEASPESETQPEKFEKSGLSSSAWAVRLRSQLAMALPSEVRHFRSVI
jgi:hypothetical protein